MACRAALMLVMLFCIANGAAAIAPATVLDLQRTAHAEGSLGKVPAVWSHDGVPAAHEVALFRGAFDLPAPAAAARLEIFADTRYELWVDGEPVGRGPMRFSETSRPVDHWPLAALSTGRHVVAVRAQWAPNTRRSASTRPHLVARVIDQVSSRPLIVSDRSWRARTSAAWRTDARPVHAWQLIGPMELLDFERLPAEWTAPSFDDSRWPPVVEVAAMAERAGRAATAAAATLLQRDGPPLAQLRVKPRLVSSGLISPDWRMFQLEAAAGSAISAQLVLTHPRSITIETLIAPEPPASLGDPSLPPPTSWSAPEILVAGSSLSWRPAPPNGPLEMPNSVRATIALAAGIHSFVVADPPVDGLALAILPRTHVSLIPSNAVNGASAMDLVAHPGRRLLLARPLDQSHESHPRAVAITETSEGLDVRFLAAPAFVVLDLGRTTLGRLAGVVGGPPGAVLDAGWDERLTTGTTWPLPHPGVLHPHWSQVDSWRLDGTGRELATIDARAGRYVVLAAWSPGVEISGLQVIEEAFPGAPSGWLSTGDELLDAVWEAGEATLRANRADVWADPWRERGMWMGDAWAADRAARALWSDATLRRRGLHLYGEEMRSGRIVGFAPRGDASEPRDYAMLWLLDLHDMLRRESDADFLDAQWPAVIALLDRLERESIDGLLSPPPGPWHRSSFIDWAAGEARYGRSVPLNSLYAATLDAAADLSIIRGRGSDAARWRSRAGEVRGHLMAELWRDDEGRFATTIVEGRTVPASAHAQAWPLALGMVPPAREDEVSDALLALLPSADLDADDPNAVESNDLPTVEIYGFHLVLEALGRSGRVPEGLSAIRRWYGPLLEHGLSTWPESWGATERWDASLSHGWGAAPTAFMSRWLLGARRESPSTWRLRPALSGVPAVAGALPLPQGNLEISWRTAGCQSATIDLDVPSGTRGIVELALAAGGTIVLDGREIHSAPARTAGIWLPRVDVGPAIGRTTPWSPAYDVSHNPRFTHVAVGQGRHRFELSPLGPPACR